MYVRVTTFPDEGATDLEKYSFWMKVTDEMDEDSFSIMRDWVKEVADKKKEPETAG